MGRGRWTMAGAGLALALGLAGCGTPMTLHEPGAHAAPPGPVAFAKPRSELAALAFTRVGAAIARGKVVGSAYYVPLRCAYTTTPEITWTRARQLTRDVEFQDTFFRVFDGAGYNVLNRPDQLFQTADSRERPAYEIGAQITDLRINLCSELLFPLGIVTDRVFGEASMVVEWQVFSSLDRRIVRTFKTTGRATLDTALDDGDRVLILDAFAAAAERLSREAPMAALANGAAPQTASIKAAVTGNRIDIARIAPYTTPIARRMGSILGATVTVLLGSGHGSGFVVSRDGLILTNNHVVADAKQVRIQFASGVKIDGEVLRRDPRRDVALVRVAATLDHPLPIRAPLDVRVGEEVSAIGAPLSEDLSSTVTRGIVSALRDDPERGRFIQSDAAIHPGNSGGPLLDRHGNVIGISVAALVDPASGQVAPGLNLFIPIDEALERLNLRLLPP